MTTVFLDESGDLGFDFTKNATSRFFVVAALICQDSHSIDKVVKKIFRSFTKTQIRSRHGMLHAFKEDKKTNEHLLRGLAALDISVIVIRLDKTRVYTPMKNERHLLYNYIVNILLDRLVNLHIVPADQPLHVVASQRETSGFLNQNFKSYITLNNDHRIGPKVEVTITPPSTFKGLQAADCVSWSFFQKYEHGNPTFADLLMSKVVEESSIYG